jgi:hypothetical protein
MYYKNVMRQRSTGPSKSNASPYKIITTRGVYTTDSPAARQVVAGRLRPVRDRGDGRGAGRRAGARPPRDSELQKRFLGPQQYFRSKPPMEHTAAPEGTSIFGPGRRSRGCESCAQVLGLDQRSNTAADFADLVEYAFGAGLRTGLVPTPWGWPYLARASDW